MGTLANEIETAVAIQRELDRLCSMDSGLTPKAAIAEAIRLGGDPKQAELVRKTIETGDADGLLLRGAFRRLAEMVKGFRRTSVLKPERMGSYLGDAVEPMGRLGISRAWLMLFTITTLTKSNPELWGEQDDPIGHSTMIAEAKDALAQAHGRIRAAVALSDLTCHPIHAKDKEDGKSLLSFKIANDEIYLGDGQDFPVHLVAWTLSQRSAGRKAA